MCTQNAQIDENAPENQSVRILINKESGTRHIAKDEDKYQSLCGFNGVSRDGYDLWEVGESTWLDSYPEDFGKLPSDCSKCAAVWQQSNSVE